MKDLFSTFKGTLTNSQIYTQIISQPFRKSFFYFLAWYGLASFILSLVLNLTLIPKTYQAVQQILNQLQTDYPDPLTITISAGKLSLSPPDSPTPITFTNPLPDKPFPILLLIDPSLSAESITQFNTLLLATQNALAVRQPLEKNSVTIFNLDQLAPKQLTITKTDVEAAISHSRDQISSLYQIRWLALPFIVVLSLITSRLLFLVIYTLPLLLITLMIGPPLSLSTIWKISLHTIVLTDLVILVIKTLYQESLAWLYVLAFLGISTIALYSLRSPAARTPPA